MLQGFDRGFLTSAPSFIFTFLSGMSITTDCHHERERRFSGVDDEWHRKLERSHFRVNTLVKNTRARREHQGHTLLWWPGPVTAKVGRKEREELITANKSTQMWEESENRGKLRTAARKWSRGDGCACYTCGEFRWAYLRDATRFLKWTVNMYESQQPTAGRTLGGNGEKKRKKPNWVDFEWNIELKDVELDVCPEYDGDVDVYLSHLPPAPGREVNLLDLVVAAKVSKRRSEFGVLAPFYSNNLIHLAIIFREGHVRGYIQGSLEYTYLLSNS
jgi:hypothetical protein